MGSARSCNATGRGFDSRLKLEGFCQEVQPIDVATVAKRSNQLATTR